MTREVPESLPGAAGIFTLGQRIFLVSGIVLIALGIMMFVSGWRTRLAARVDERLTIPLGSNQLTKAHFTASGKFPIAIEFSLSPQHTDSERKPDPAKLDQLKKLDLEWSFRDGGSVVAAGNASNAPHYNPHAAYYRSTQLGFVRLPRPGTFEFTIRANSSLPADAGPTVALNPFVGRAMVNVAVKNFVGGVLLMLGLLLIVVALLCLRGQRS